MTSYSSTQCAPFEVLGALLFTAPRLWPSSWAAVDASQQPLSTLPYDGPEFERLLSDFRVSPANSPMPQYTLVSVNITYLRSLRLKHLARTALIDLPKSLRSASAIATLRMTGWLVPLPWVTNRRRRLPPVSAAEAL